MRGGDTLPPQVGRRRRHRSHRLRPSRPAPHCTAWAECSGSVHPAQHRQPRVLPAVTDPAVPAEPERGARSPQAAQPERGARSPHSPAPPQGRARESSGPRAQMPQYGARAAPSRESGAEGDGARPAPSASRLPLGERLASPWAVLKVKKKKKLKK